MKVRLIYPRFERFLEAYPELAGVPSIAGLWEFKMPPALGVPMLATMMPDDIEWAATDGNVSEIDYDEDVDLVALSFFTPQAANAFEVADRFRARGVKVVMGGMHTTLNPEDSAAHADAICVGEAEGAWPQMLKDAQRGELRKVYKAALTPPEQWAKPMRSLFSDTKHYDWGAGLVQVARGCPRACPYCNMPGMHGPDLRLRPIDDVVEDVASLSGRDLYLTEDMIMFKARNVAQYTSELFERLVPIGPKIFLTSALVFNSKPSFLTTLRAGGAQCNYVTFGFDPLSRGVYSGDERLTEAAREIVQRTEEHGIRFYAAFGLGFDDDEPEVFDRILRFCDDANIVTAEFFVATPFPGTPMFHQLKREGRLLHEDWSKYNCAHVVHKPKQMSVEALEKGFLELWQEYYKDADMDEALGCFNGDRMGPSARIHRM